MPSISTQLVAVAVAADQIYGSGHYRSSEIPDLPSRLNPILDSLASIYIRKGKGEVYAVATQFHEKNDGSTGGKLALTTAGNSAVPPEVVSHLQSVLS